MISFKHRGGFTKFEKFAKSKRRGWKIYQVLARYAQQGVAALASATPVRSGATAASWGYEIESNGDSYSIVFTNSHINKGVNIAIILQYGHGTGTGGYVQGIDYINPAIQPIFTKIADSAWKEVTG